MESQFGNKMEYLLISPCGVSTAVRCQLYVQIWSLFIQLFAPESVNLLKKRFNLPFYQFNQYLNK